MAPVLIGGDVEVWIADLDDRRWDRFSETLTEEEQAHAARFRVPRVSERYRRCRGLLRHLLAEYLYTAADKVEVELGPFGKPRIPADPIQFNISHSRNMAAIAFAHTAIGVDIEYIDMKSSNINNLFSHFCSGREIERLSALSEVEAACYFYAIWTQKEAYVKAIGLGLRHPLDGVEVIQAAGSLTGYVTDTNAIDAHTYHLFALPILAEYECHVCMHMQDPKIVVRHP